MEFQVFGIFPVSYYLAQIWAVAATRLTVRSKNLYHLISVVCHFLCASFPLFSLEIRVFLRVPVLFSCMTLRPQAIKPFLSRTGKIVTRVLLPLLLLCGQLQPIWF